VYVILASDGSLYTGITTDLQRRFEQHESGKGARYFHAGRRPEKIVFTEKGHDRSSASRREAAIKKLARRDKLILIDR
jgi:putative endonuclease